MKLPNKVFDVMKWIVLVVIPAFSAAYVGLSEIWGFPYADQVSKTSVVVCALLGALLGISTIQYNKAQTIQPPDEE